MGLKTTTLFLGGGFIWAMKEKDRWLLKVYEGGWFFVQWCVDDFI